MKHREALKIPSYCCNNPEMLLDNPFSCKLLYMVRTCGLKNLYIFMQLKFSNQNKSILISCYCLART